MSEQPTSVNESRKNEPRKNKPGGNESWVNELNEAMALLERGQPKLCLTSLHAMLQERAGKDFCRALVFDGMGRALFADGQPALGMEAFNESLSILRRLHSAHEISPEFMQGALQNQAHAHLVMGSTDIAKKIGAEALDLAEKAWGLDSPRVAQALFHLSAPYYNTKDYDKAENMLLRAKKIWEAQPGEMAEEVGTCLNNLGRIYEERGQNETGADYHRRAVELRRALPNKEDLAFSLGNYGVALGSGGKLKEACDALRECVVIYNALGKGAQPEAKAFEANLSLFERAIHESAQGDGNG